MMMRPHSPAFSLLSDFDRAGRADTMDLEALRKAAFEEGYRQGHAEGRAEAEADADILVAEAAARHAEEIIEQKLAWEGECADVLVARLEAAEHAISRTIEERMAVLLRPWLIDRLRERALRELEKAISRSLVDGAKVHIEAPSGIIQRLRERLSSPTLQIGFSESATADIRAHVEDTEIEANISAWIADLEAAVP